MSTPQTTRFDQLLACAAGELDADEAAAVEGRIRGDREAVRMLAALREVVRAMREDDTVSPRAELIERAAALLEQERAESMQPPALEAPSLAERVRRVIAELVFDSAAGPALAGFRGFSPAGEARHMTFRSGDVEVDLHVPAGGRIVRVRGQIACDPAAVGRRATAVRLVDPGEGTPNAMHRVWGPQALVAESSPDERGRFAFDAHCGRYSVEIVFPDQVVVLQDVRVE